MFDLNVQYKKEDGSQASFTIEVKSMPMVGDFIQYSEKEALEVKRVYHIPKTIDQSSNGEKADAILFVEFVEDRSVSDF